MVSKGRLWGGGTQRSGSLGERDMKGGDFMEKRTGYAGRISHSGAQKVTAPMSGGTKRGKTVKKQGDDLRNGK